MRKFSGKKSLVTFYKWLNPPGMTHGAQYNPSRLLSDFVECDDETYYEFLEMLPPLHWSRDGFSMCEATTFDIRLAFFRIGNRFFAAQIRDTIGPSNMGRTRRDILEWVDYGQV